MRTFPVLYSNLLAQAGYNTAGLYVAVTRDAKSILCARCHLSNALPGTGVKGIYALTQAIHSRHANVRDPVTGLTLDAANNRASCYRCHPGSETRCLRGAMGTAVAGDGALAIQCQSCHGSMSAVGAEDRQGWLEEPNCQSCHTGTAVNNRGQIRFTSVFDTTGQVRQAATPIFATSKDAPATGLSLYRFSSGHGGLRGEACHGSTHAEFPSSHVSDNLQSQQLQGHAGVLAECSACHSTPPATFNGGPHGMHSVGQTWVGDGETDGAEVEHGIDHQNAVEQGGVAQCQACHGVDYRGTVLSRAQADRTLTAFGTKQIWKGFQIGCYTCHSGPNNDDASPNRPAVVSSASASTLAGFPEV